MTVEIKPSRHFPDTRKKSDHDLTWADTVGIYEAPNIVAIDRGRRIHFSPCPGCCAPAVVVVSAAVSAGRPIDRVVTSYFDHRRGL